MFSKQFKNYVTEPIIHKVTGSLSYIMSKTRIRVIEKSKI